MYKRIAFPVTIDEYSMLTITGDYYLADKSKYNQLSFLAQIGKNVTAINSVFIQFIKLYYTKDKFIVPLFNLVVKLNKGNISDIVWVNDCYTCLNTDQCNKVSNISSIFSNKTVNQTYYTDNVYICSRLL
jgi:hypothetical protein